MLSAEDDAFDGIDAGAEHLDTALITQERDAVLWRAFGTLPDRCRTLLRVLMASPAPSYQEISDALGLPVGSIGPTRARCLARLRAVLAADGITHGSGDVEGCGRSQS